MVEMDYSGLKSKKYCSQSHSSRIEVFCTQDGLSAVLLIILIICRKLSIFESKLANYRQLKTKIKIMSNMQSSSDEIRSYVPQLLESHLIK